MKRVLSESNQTKLFYEWHVPQRNKVERLGLRKGCNLGMLLVQLFWKFNMANETKSTMSLNPGLGSFALWLFGSQIGVSNVIPGSQQGVTVGDRGSQQEWLENAALPRQLLSRRGSFIQNRNLPHPSCWYVVSCTTRWSLYWLFVLIISASTERRGTAMY